jgi:hypothetical protein
MRGVTAKLPGVVPAAVEEGLAPSGGRVYARSISGSSSLGGSKEVDRVNGLPVS